MGLEASLTDFSASQIFFLLSKFNKTGKIELRSGGEKGEVFFIKGKVTHAIFKKMTGIEALYNLSIFTHGQIQFLPDEKTAEVSIKDEVSTLIGEIERRKVEFNEIKKKLPPFDSVLLKLPKPPESPVALRKDDWKILVLMDGKKNINEVIEKSGIGALSAYKTITWLLEKGLIYDPKENERMLKEKITFINILFKELIAHGIAESELLKLFRNSLLEGEEGRKLLENIISRGANFRLKSKMHVGISKGEIEELFTEIVKLTKEKCIGEFGPMLAKKSFDAALKKSSDIK